MGQKDIYDKVWMGIDEGSPRPFLEYKSELMRKYLERNNGIALDIGCGDGFFTFKLLELGFRVDAIDVSTEAIKSTKNRVKNRRLSEYVNLFNKNLFEFEPKQKYDVILCLEVLEHIENDINALKLINQWLKPEGTLIVSVPHRQDLWNYSDEAGGHYRRYSKHDLTKKFEKSDLKVEEIFDYGFPFIRFFVHGFCVQSAEKQKSQISPPKNSFINRNASKIIKFLCKMDSNFLNNDKGINLVAIAKKANK